MFRSCFDPS